MQLEINSSEKVGVLAGPNAKLLVEIDRRDIFWIRLPSGERVALPLIAEQLGHGVFEFDAQSLRPGGQIDHFPMELWKVIDAEQMLLILSLKKSGESTYREAINALLAKWPDVPLEHLKDRFVEVVAERAMRENSNADFRRRMPSAMREVLDWIMHD